ncbi:hypothetical protein NKG05_20490 [Oerskovia sp. M15]
MHARGPRPPGAARVLAGPRQLVLRARVDRAAELLATTSTPIAEVAVVTGSTTSPRSPGPSRG